MAYRVGKKNIHVAIQTDRRAVFTDTPVITTKIGLSVKCICGRTRRLKSMEADLLRGGQSPRFKCACGAHSYNIVDTNSLVGPPEIKEKSAKQRVNKLLAQEILRSGLSVDKVAVKYNLNKQAVYNIFRNKDRYLKTN